MTNSQKKLTIKLLEMAAQEFSNHGCNDFDSSKYLSPKERDQLVLEQFGEMFGEPKSPDWRLPDYTLMYAMASILEEELANDLT